MRDAQCPIETTRRVLAVFHRTVMVAIMAALTLRALPCTAQQLTNSALSVTVNSQDGSYQFGPIGSQSALQTLGLAERPATSDQRRPAND
jgi:hypothetical protein